MVPYFGFSSRQGVKFFSIVGYDDHREWVARLGILAPLVAAVALGIAVLIGLPGFRVALAATGAWLAVAAWAWPQTLMTGILSSCQSPGCNLGALIRLGPGLASLLLTVSGALIAAGAIPLGRTSGAGGPPGPGWFADPSGQAGQRYWDGTNWTEQIR